MAETKTPRWMKVTLAASLAVNLGIAGVVGGAMLRAPTYTHDHTTTPDGIAMLARAMPAAYQGELRSSLRDRQADLRPDRETIRRLRDRFTASLTREPFDINEVNLVFIDQRAMLSNLTATGHDAIIRQIERMSPRDRARYIERLSAQPHLQDQN